MLATETFVRSPQLAVFLRFVVEMALRGEAQQIKGYTIGVEALGRPSGFDPQIDPIVRVEGTRLRRTLERYYSGPGANDEVLIDLPRGSYVPSFRRRGGGAGLPRPLSSERFLGLERRTRILAMAAAFVALLIVVAVAFDAVRWFGDGTAPQLGDGMPRLTIAVTSTGEPVKNPISASLVAERLHDAFTRFDAINVVTEAGEAPPDYRFQATLEHFRDATVTLRVRLEDTAENRIVWSKTYERLPLDRPVGAYEYFVVEIATTLLQPFGVIRARERMSHLASGTGDPRYRCVIETSESLRSFDPDQHLRARACLEQLTTRDPSFAIGFRYLAAVHLREFLFGTGTRTSDAATLDRALHAARRALELQPESSRGYHTLASILLARGDVQAAFAASDRAVLLNKYDLSVLGDYAGRLVSAGETERGTSMLQQAVVTGVLRPSTQLFYLFLGSYLRGDHAAAILHANQITADSYTLGRLARALAAVDTGDQERARQEASRLVALNKAWGDDPRGQLEKFFPSQEVVDRLARGLLAAGIGGSG